MSFFGVARIAASFRSNGEASGAARLRMGNIEQLGPVYLEDVLGELLRSQALEPLRSADFVQPGRNLSGVEAGKLMRPIAMPGPVVAADAPRDEHLEHLQGDERGI